MNGPLALIVADADGGFDVVDARDGLPVAWRGELVSAGEIVVFVNSTYPTGAIPPAHDSLAHEIAMWRIGGEPELPLCRLDEGELRRMIPDGIDDRPALWKPAA